MQIKDIPVASEARYTSSFSAPSEDLDLQWLIRTLLRRKWAIIIPAVVVTLLTGALLTQLTPTYDGYAEVVIDTRQANLADLQSVLTNGLTDDEAMESEVRILQSRNLAYKLMDALQLDKDPEFNEALQDKTIIDEVKGWIRGTLTSFGILSPKPVLTPEQELAEERSDTVDDIMDAIAVELKTKSRVMGITFTSEDPDLAARAANKLAELYILEDLDAKYEATRRATQWLTDKIAELRHDVSASDAAVEKFRAKAGLLQGTGGNTLTSESISDLNTQLVTIRTERAEAEARLAQARQLARTPNGAESVGDVLKSPIIQQLVDQEAQVKRKVAELAEEYGDRHPRLISARAELNDLQQKIQREVAKVVSALENEANVARARESTLSRNLDDLKGQLASSNNANVQLQALQRDADASRAMLESFMTQFEQTSAQLDQSISQASARMISRADSPDQPTFPPIKLILAVAFVGTTLFAAIIVLGLEQLDSGFRSGEQVEKVTGLRSLGLVPVVKAGGSSKSPAGYLLRHPSSMFGESIRSLYTSILLTPNQAPPKKLLITSSQPKEGKTTIALCLGRMRALAGHPTVIIEADLRRPSLHRVLGVQRRPGLVEVILGEAQLADVLVKDTESGAYLIPAGKLTPDPTEIVSSPRMKELLEQLGRQFALIVIDSPPVVAVADARLLATQVDATVLIVRWAKTGRDVANLAVKQLQEAGGTIAGMVLSMVDSKRHAKYGFADSAYYYGAVKRYYTS